MDFRVIFQLRTKRFWWMDVIFYFAVSLLIATMFSYFVFLIKNAMQRNDINETAAALETVGTQQQKEYEKSVIDYQKKVRDFAELFKNHEFASHTFAFMQKQTLSNIWFKQFGLDRKNAKVQLFGEADNMEAFSRQVANFEKNEYVKSVGALNSALAESARAEFNLNLALDSKIFSYVPETDTAPLESTTSPSSEALFQMSNKDSQKMITVFDVLLDQEIIGRVDQINYTITADVPYGTNVKNLRTLIIISPGAAVQPSSGIAQDFTNPVIYKVTAKDGSIQNYIATVNVLPKGGKKPSQEGLGSVLMITIASLAATVIVFLAVFWFLKRRLKSKKQPKNAN